MTLSQILEQLQSKANPERARSLERFAIPSEKAFGITMPVLRKLAKEAGKDQVLAEQLWKEGPHECKLLATLIADPVKFSITQADRWVREIYSWDVCDQLCINLLSKTSYAWDLPRRWAPEEHEFTRRAGIVMIAVMAVHHKKVEDEEFLQFIPILKEYATDPRNFVKKAVNWAIRQMGKRSFFLHQYMLTLCYELLELDFKAAKWIARDALRELKG